MEKSKSAYSSHSESTSIRTGSQVKDRVATYQQQTTTTQVASRQVSGGSASYRSGSSSTRIIGSSGGAVTNGSHVKIVEITDGNEYSSQNGSHVKMVEYVDGIDYSSRLSSVTLKRQSERETVKTLNSHLANYIEFIRSKDLSEEAIIKIITIIKKELTNVRGEVEKDVENVYFLLIEELERKIKKLQATYDDWDSKIKANQRKLDSMRSSYQEEINAFISGEVTRIEKSVRQKVRIDYEAKLVREIQILRQQFIDYCARYSPTVDAGAVRIDLHSFFYHAYEQKYIVAGKVERIDELNAEIIYLKAVFSALANQIASLRVSSKSFEYTDIFTDQILALIKQEFIRNIIFHKYGYLLDIDEKFDLELSRFEQLIHSEEARLQIGFAIDEHIGRSFITKGHSNKEVVIKEAVQGKSYVDSAHRSTTFGSQQFTSDGHSDCDVVIDEVNLHGDYIRLKNNGGKEFHLGSWIIKAVAKKPTGDEIRKFMLQSNQVLMPGKTITIWSPNRGGLYNPPESYVMKDVVWPNFNRIRVELLDQNEKRQAYLETYSDVEVLKKSAHIL
jgi:tetrahydromethanopterin S-methyltransferase subunit B